MTVFILKIIALICMVIDHVGYFFIKDDTYLTYRIIGRIAAPVFLFIFVEGFLKTKDRRKYQKRLLISSLAMFVGNFILNLFIDNMYPLNTNIFFTMFLCSCILTLFEDWKWRKVLDLAVLLLFLHFAEYSYIALFCVLVFYIYLKLIENKSLVGDKIMKFSIKSAFVAVYFIGSIIVCWFMDNILQVSMVLAILPILLYNGKLGLRNKFIKYFYYIFYMAHLWLFAILRQFFA